MSKKRNVSQCEAIPRVRERERCLLTEEVLQIDLNNYDTNANFLYHDDQK